uniref:Uncharacterized protein n=1 Tax=Oryza sativa subsp. japonica TaxID=39947 RepID=Q6ZF27_ORYSJ|nr:hypothetical protein [Oryza sativa Japonica Group]
MCKSKIIVFIEIRRSTDAGVWKRSKSKFEGIQGMRETGGGRSGDGRSSGGACSRLSSSNRRRRRPLRPGPVGRGREEQRTPPPSRRVCACRGGDGESKDAAAIVPRPDLAGRGQDMNKNPRPKKDVVGSGKNMLHKPNDDDGEVAAGAAAVLWFSLLHFASTSPTSATPPPFPPP